MHSLSTNYASLESLHQLIRIFNKVQEMTKEIFDRLASRHQYDVALSFAEEDREYVDQVARILVSSNVRVFYDSYEEADLWGKDLYTHLNDIYQNRAKFTIIFISKYYSSKLWTNHECKSAQTRAFRERREYILPARFDDSEIPGLSQTIGYINLQKKSPSELCALILKKLRPDQKIQPRHMFVSSENKYYYPGYALFESGLFLEGKRSILNIIIDPDRYSAFDEILDDLFVHYLSHYVEPFSYGSQWLIRGEPNNTHLLVPHEWVCHPGDPTCEIAPGWSASTSPEDFGITKNSRWEIIGIGEDRHGLTDFQGMPKAYVLGCNDQEISQMVLSNAKAVVLLLRKGNLKKITLDDFKPEVFRYKHVFVDWLGISRTSASIALIESGEKLSEEILANLRHR